MQPISSTLDLKSLAELSAEVARARRKFPGARFLFTALVEEYGELGELMDIVHLLDLYAKLGARIGNGLGRALIQGKGRERIRAEALQVACVAMRIYEESDPVYDSMTAQEQQP